MEWREGKDDEESGKTTDLKGFEKLDVGEMGPTMLYHHLHLNLGRMLPCLLSLPHQKASKTLPQGNVWIICHQDCSFSHSDAGVTYIVSTGKGQVSAGTISKEKAFPWKQECKERRETSDSRSLGWITFGGEQTTTS